MKRSEETSEKARDIIYGITKNYSSVELYNFPTFKSLINRIRKNRNKKHKDVFPLQSDIPLSIRNISTGDVFLQHDSGINDDNRVVIFCTDDNLIHLEVSKIILMDGTFKSSPRGFKQLYTLVVYINKKYIPLIFVLMRSKNEASYTKICNFLRQKAPNFSPEMIILDFELAPRRSFSRMFPCARMFGCLFHFSQNIWRKIQDLKLVTEYKEQGSFRENVRKLLSLSFVRPDKVAEYFFSLKRNILQRCNLWMYNDLLIYFEKNYINISEKDLEFWNLYDRVLLDMPRTTNCLEGFHRGLNSLFLRTNPDIGLFGEELLKEHLFSRKKMLNALYKSQNYSQSNLRELSLKSIVSEFENYSLFEYIYAVSIAFQWPI